MSPIDVVKAAFYAQQRDFPLSVKAMTLEEVTEMAAERVISALCAAGLLSEWQPIETAPRDGTPVLLGDGRVVHEMPEDYTMQPPFKAAWRDGWTYIHQRGGWKNNWRLCDTGYYGALVLEPTCWMPLPTPPKENKE